MSHYCLINVEFRDVSCLLKALAVMGFPSEQVEVHDNPVKLRDYAGKLRPESANVVIRREHLSGAHNDIGFRTGTKSEAIICEYSQSAGFGQKWLNRLRQEYAVAATVKHYAKSGKKVQRVDEEDGRVHLYVNA